MSCVIHTIPHHARGLLWLEHCIASMWYLRCDSVHWWDGMRVHDSMHGCGGMAYVCGVTVGLALCDGLDFQVRRNSILVFDPSASGCPSV